MRRLLTLVVIIGALVANIGCDDSKPSAGSSGTGTGAPKGKGPVAPAPEPPPP